MATTSPSAALVPATPVFSTAQRLALAGFPAGYSGLTRRACELGLRQYAPWCQTRHLALFSARRADIERAHRTLVITRKGGKVVTIPLAPRTTRAIDLRSASAARDRCSSLRTADGWTGTAPGGSSAGPPAAPGRPSPPGPAPCATPFHRSPGHRRTAPRRPGSRLPTDPRTTMRHDRAMASPGRHATYIVAAYIAGAARQPGTARRTAWPARPSQAAGARPPVTQRARPRASTNRRYERQPGR
jgi:hypothetical protein